MLPPWQPQAAWGAPLERPDGGGSFSIPSTRVLFPAGSPFESPPQYAAFQPSSTDQRLDRIIAMASKEPSMTRSYSPGPAGHAQRLEPAIRMVGSTRTLSPGPRPNTSPASSTGGFMQMQQMRRGGTGQVPQVSSQPPTVPSSPKPERRHSQEVLLTGVQGGESKASLTTAEQQEFGTKVAQSMQDDPRLPKTKGTFTRRSTVPDMMAFVQSSAGTAPGGSTNDPGGSTNDQGRDDDAIVHRRSHSALRRASLPVQLQDPPKTVLPNPMITSSSSTLGSDGDQLEKAKRRETAQFGNADDLQVLRRSSSVIQMSAEEKEETLQPQLQRATSAIGLEEGVQSMPVRATSKSGLQGLATRRRASLPSEAFSQGISVPDESPLTRATRRSSVASMLPVPEAPSSSVPQAPPPAAAAPPTSGLQGLAARRRASMPSGMGMTAAEQLASQLAGLGEIASEPIELEENPDENMAMRMAARRASAPSFVVNDQGAKNEETKAASQWASLKGRLSGVSMMKKLADKARDRSQQRQTSELSFVDPLEAAHAAACLTSPMVMPVPDTDTSRSPWHLLKMTAECGPAGRWRPDQIIAEEKQEYLLWALQNLPPPELQDLLQDLQKSVSVQKDRVVQMNSTINNVLTNFATRSKMEDPAEQLQSLAKRVTSKSPAPKKSPARRASVASKSVVSLGLQVAGSSADKKARDDQNEDSSPTHSRTTSKKSVESSPRSKMASKKTLPEDSSPASKKSAPSESPKHDKKHSHKDGQHAPSSPKSPRPHVHKEHKEKAQEQKQEKDGKSGTSPVSMNKGDDAKNDSVEGTSINTKLKQNMLKKLRDGTLKDIAANMHSSVKETNHFVKAQSSEHATNDYAATSPSKDSLFNTDSTASTAPMQEADLQASLMEAKPSFVSEDEAKFSKKKRNDEAEETVLAFPGPDGADTGHGRRAEKPAKPVGGEGLDTANDGIGDHKHSSKHRRASMQALGGSSSHPGAPSTSPSTNVLESANDGTEPITHSYQIFIHGEEAQNSSATAFDRGTSLEDKRSSSHPSGTLKASEDKQRSSSHASSLRRASEDQQRSSSHTSDLLTASEDKQQDKTRSSSHAPSSQRASEDKRRSSSHEPGLQRGDSTDSQKLERSSKGKSSKRMSALALDGNDHANESIPSHIEVSAPSTHKSTKSSSADNIAESQFDHKSSKSDHKSASSHALEQASKSHEVHKLERKNRRASSQEVSANASTPVGVFDHSSHQDSHHATSKLRANPHHSSSHTTKSNTLPLPKHGAHESSRSSPMSAPKSPKAHHEQVTSSVPKSPRAKEERRKSGSKPPSSPGRSKEERRKSGSKPSPSPRDLHSPKARHDSSGTSRLLAPPGGRGTSSRSSSYSKKLAIT